MWVRGIRSTTEALETEGWSWAAETPLTRNWKEKGESVFQIVPGNLIFCPVPQNPVPLCIADYSDDNNDTTKINAKWYVYVSIQ